ncbi:response regulator [Candidatus Bathyarchaeota archaeon]|nr:response regulator [Candidatus Bathyarchaeota archaeon]
MGERTRILIVDDDESIRKTISTILEENGYKVDTAKDGRQAIEKTEARFYNLALIDIKLPDMEGTELLDKMRDTTPRMVKIIVTGFPSLRNAVEAVNKSADAYLIKPVKIEELLETIRLHLEIQEEERRYNEQTIAAFLETRLLEQKEIATCKIRK